MLEEYEMNFKLESVKNARSLEGVKSKFGILNNKLFRSGRLDSLTNNDIEALKNANVRNVIDLRTITEQNERPDILPSFINFYSNPVLDEETMGITRDDKSRVDIISLIKENAHDHNYAKRYMESTYLNLIQNPSAINAYKKLFDVLLNKEEGILWHCSAGKDRAGIATMYVLLALGVEKDEIIKNYLKTNEYLSDENQMIVDNVKQRHGEFLANQIKDIFFCDEEYIEIVFKYIYDNYRTIDNFLGSVLELDQHKLLKLQEKYLKK